ncbi:TPA: phage tail spike protein [Enterococcus faecalis]
MIVAFDKLMNVVAPINEESIMDLYEELPVTGIGNTFYMATEPNTITEEMRYIGIPSETGELFRIYEISQRKENEFEDEFTGVDFAIKDLQKDGVVIEFRNNGSDFKGVVTSQILKGSSWMIGSIDFTTKTNESFYYQSRWECLQALIEESGCEIQLLVAISNNTISRRYINFFKQIGKETQKRFEYGSNLLSVTKDSDTSDIITRIYPRGKGEEKQDENGESTGNFTRRITIKDVEWKKSTGNPLDKPKGQEWLEDPTLTAMYPLHTGNPRTGVVIYESCEDPKELIQLGYETLKLNGVPKAEFKIIAPTDSPLSLGDIVTVVNYERIYDLRTRIFKMKRFPLEPFNNEYTFGDEVNRSAYKEVQNIIHKNNENIFEYVNGKVIGAANGINKVYFGKEFPTKAMKGDLFYKYIGINEKGEQDIEMWEFEGSTWNKIVDTAMADADRLIKGRIDAGKINVINLNAANVTTGILRGIRLEGNTIVSDNGSSNVTITNGYVESRWAGKLFTRLDGGAFQLYRTNGYSLLGGFYRTVFPPTGREYLNITAMPGTSIFLGRTNNNGEHIGSLEVSGNTGRVTLNNTELGMDLIGNNKAIKDIYIVGLKTPNNATANFYSPIDMHGYPIYNQSDIRLKENITPISFSGIKETKRIEMVEFDYKQSYDNLNSDQQRPTGRQFGIIAQSTNLLSEIADEKENHYLSVDLKKQVNLNTLTNKELIENIEKQEGRIKKLERLVADLCKND